MKNIGITVFGCEQDEAAVFHELSPHFDVEPTITSVPVAECGTIPANGNQCISVGHKSRVSESNLVDLQKAGVKYISTRSAGYDHIDTRAAMKMGIAVGNVAYSPDSVADYTIMLMLMAIRNAKPIVTGAEKFDFRLDAVRGKELRDMTVGVVGAGRIALGIWRGCVPLRDFYKANMEKDIFMAIRPGQTGGDSPSPPVSCCTVKGKAKGQMAF